MKTQPLSRALAFLQLAMIVGVLSGCAATDIERYAAERPALDLRQYFNGTIEGHGMVLDRSGEVTRRFVVNIEATWQGDTAELDENFVWSDGLRERRVWTLKPGRQPGQWIGTAADVVGQAHGKVAGNALNWSYTLAYKTAEGRTFELDFDDWMFLIDERVMLNRAVMRFWGFKVGEVLISFERRRGTP